MTTVDVLSLSNTLLTDDGLQYLKDLTNLQYLDLNDTQLTDDGLQHLKGLTNLERLHLNSTQLTDDGLQHLKGLTNLHLLVSAVKIVAPRSIKIIEGRRVDLRFLSSTGASSLLFVYAHQRVIQGTGRPRA